MSFPRGVGEIDVAWLRARLAENGVDGADRLRAFSAEPVASQGMTSLAHVLTLAYDGERGEAPPKLLCKFSLDLEPVKAALAVNRGFEREVTFYRQFGQRAGIAVPRCYWAAFDADETRSALLLEFIADGRTTDTISGEIADVEKVVTALAPFHAAWWGRNAELAAIPPGFAPFMVDMLRDKLAAALDAIKTRYRADVGATLIDLLEFWIPNAHRIAAAEREKPQTLCHGDLHRNQILFTARPDPGFCLIDWQLAGADTGPTDLAHLLVTGLRPDQRATAETRLIETYHAGLLRGGVNGHSLDDTRASYRVGIARLAVFYMSAFAMGDIAPAIAWWDSDPKHRGVSFWEAICGWTGRALDDHRVLDHLDTLRRA